MSLDWIHSLSLANTPLADDSTSAATINAAHATNDTKATNFIPQNVLLLIQLLWLAQETYIIFNTKIVHMQ